jgi:NitT/TauT family transport system substrate-binding protein
MMKRALLALILAAATLSPAFPTEAGAATKITFVTDWKAQAEHGGFYQALAEGLYARRGLDVKIVPGGPEVNVPQLLAGGAADFGIGSNSFITLNIVRQGLPLKAVMAIFQKDPQVLMSHPRRDIRGLADMKGKPVLISAASMTAFWPWLKAKFGFTDSQIRKYTFNLAPFITDPNAIQEGYLTSEPFTVEQKAGWKPKVFLLADDGYPGYANMVLVPQKWIDTNPKAVQAFVSATRDGWLHYLNGDNRKANAMIKAANPEMTDAVIAQSIARMKQYNLVLSREGNELGLGSMTEKRWRIFYDTMASEGLYPKGLDFRKAYDLHFIRNTVQNFQ